MKRLSTVNWQNAALTLLASALMVGMIRFFTSTPEIALVLGEPWEDMRQRSNVSIGPAVAGYYWGAIPKSDARLRFIDPQYGFVSPPARFFMIRYNDMRVADLSLSPQVEPLLLDDTLKVVLDLQEQWRKGGWIPIHVKDGPPFADTPEWRARLRNVNQGGTSFWQAGKKYQVMLVVNRFRDVRNPTEERYLIKLQLAAPWIPQ
ncbi:hypothetical protein [Pseudomonas veronii]|uniref:Uncharacterized protein n=1 Tax=Pseudomonas veronii TaxID=76761 RepID=A0A5M8F6Z4_PSEVE|nr:hypothetical protein [Pseudomonas veronii]KAA6175004.1 hypothetical protein F3K54_16330 [Pseudomonas veronii]KAA6178631.1 hypothetical protein F3K53_14995 [Pseudomonas veronii]